LEGREIRIRFLWKKLGRDLAVWEQAFSIVGSAEWETNWTMEFTRISGEPN